MMVGIKQRSVFNDLTYFKLCDFPSVGIRHDSIAGIVQYEEKLPVINQLTAVKNITLCVNIKRIKAVNFG